ncbi:Alkaline-phosphatase-like family protein [Perilla frutescens var. frutescens]|nr:Alkaline-phosphatase-like family protein [Perilla frutescens var. frutescens]
MGMSEKWIWRSENWSGRKWAFVAFLGIMLLHSLAILLFTRGFLLTRSELSQHSECKDVAASPCFPPPRDQNANGSCWTKPVVGRLVIIVLDALRFDFVAPSTFFAEKKPWMDRLQVLHELAAQNQSSTRIFKATADPPTTSLQRLKGLTTGGLPTFIDVGNSFGAPAILEDNLIHQLVQNGKRVVMMGDDTWVQLFPDHFTTSYPFPSFNVKDLHTVDNGCITNLLPTLYEEDWDVLIAHFLGVDHAGHIFGVDSDPMIEKLEQYNEVIKKVVGALESQSAPGGLHENTLLLVMGDHGQTLNGDHGGGTAEEVETAIFALTLKKPQNPLLAATESSSCQLDVLGRRVCINSIQQLDFAATVSSLLGLPFPFGSIGRVNSELFSLAGGTWNQEKSATGDNQSQSEVQSWMLNYVNVLCINSWQVKKYIDVYSSLSLIGFSEKDLMHVSELYSEAQELWSITSRNFSRDTTERAFVPLPLVKRQIDAYSMFLESVAALARSNWTEFNLKMMGVGFCIMLSSLCLHIFLIRRLDQLCGVHSFLSGYFKNFFGANLASIVILIRAWSFLSNSFILEEGRVASFLLATTAILQLRCAIMKKMMLLEALVLCLLVPFLRISIELGQLKQAVNSLFLKVDPSNMLGIYNDSELWMYLAEVLPALALLIIAYFLYKSITSCSSQGILKVVVVGTLFNYMLILLNWASDSSLLGPNFSLWHIKGNLVPRVIYSAGLLQLSLLAIGQLIDREITSNLEQSIVVKALALISTWSSSIILLSGKQGPLFFLTLLIGGWCLIRLMALGQSTENDSAGSSISYALPVTQWSLLAVCMFFSTGHWCAFDGLRYAAAFIGFDEFILIRQAILLTIDTFGFSHILPIFGLPLLVARCYRLRQNKQVFSIRLCQVYLMYGLITAITATFTMLCVTIQRRHLMVWGLFAPKFVFDVVGLLLDEKVVLELLNTSEIWVGFTSTRGIRGLGNIWR